MSHDWQKTVLAPAQLPSEKHPKGKPEVEGWIRCRRCGAQVCQQGYGRKAQTLYRASAAHEWVPEAPPCSGGPCAHELALGARHCFLLPDGETPGPCILCENEALVRALRFYANPENWKRRRPTAGEILSGQSPESEVEEDGGKVARAALRGERDGDRG
jgi:hypothetical protein